MSMPARAREVRKFILTATASFAALLLAATEPALAITNGKPVVESDAYAHAVVGVVPLDEYEHPGTCTGILLTPRAVLTAAHCVSGDDVKQVSVVFDLAIGETHKVAVTRIVVHPDYHREEGKFNPADVAVIFLAAHDYRTVIIPLDRDRTFTNGQQFVLLGYGQNDPFRARSAGVLRKASIAANGYDTPKEVELKPLGDAWPCHGDSGGPILRKDMSGRYALAGIMNTVFAGPDHECLFVGSSMAPIHTYADWIASTLASGS